MALMLSGAFLTALVEIGQRDFGAMNFQTISSECVSVNYLDRRWCKELSERFGGNFFVGRGGHITWQCGRNSVKVINERNLPMIEDARDIAVQLVGDPCGWTIGSIARKLVAWIGSAGDLPTTLARRNVIDCWSFKKCNPCTMELGTMYDLDSCFFTILTRAVTLRPRFTTKGLIWTSPEDGEEQRFRELLEAVKGHKLLRNAIIGAMVGGSKSKAFAKGKSHTFWTNRGPRVELGAAVVRTAYELTMLETNALGAVYANTDAVIVPGDVEPKIWKAAALPYKIVDRGEAVIQGIGLYKIGNTVTKAYRPDPFRFPNIVCDPKSEPEPIYHSWIYG